MVTGLFGGNLSTRLECGNWEKRNALIAKEEKDERDKSDKRAASHLGAGPSKTGKRPLKSEHPQILSSKEQKRRRLKLDLETFEDLASNSPRRTSPRLCKASSHAGQASRGDVGTVSAAAAARAASGANRSSVGGKATKQQGIRPSTAHLLPSRPPQGGNHSLQARRDTASLPRAPMSAKQPPSRPSPLGISKAPSEAKSLPSSGVHGKGPPSHLRTSGPSPTSGSSRPGPQNHITAGNVQAGKPLIAGGSNPSRADAANVKPFVARRIDKGGGGMNARSAAAKKDPSGLLSVHQGGGFYPTAPPRRPGTYRDDDEIDSDSEGDDGFIVSDEEEEDWRAEMRQVTRYDPRK